MAVSKNNPRQKSALANLHQSITRFDLKAMRNAVLAALKADVSDAELGRTVRLAVMDRAQLKEEKRKDPLLGADCSG
jgi:hypothetical protein